MREPHHLTNAPIREALIDIFVEFPAGVERPAQIEAIKSLKTGVASEYPNAQELAVAEFEVDVQAKRSRFGHNFAGYRCMNPEKNRAVQFRTNGFTMNWLRPYTQWEEFRDRARASWELYRAAIKPAKVTKIGLRYINDLELPTPFVEFNEYLVADPIVPAGLPQEVSRFLTRVTIEDEDRAAVATITQAFEGIVDPKKVNLILDIDTRVESQFDPDDSQIWTGLDRLRNFKNRIFFMSLTEKALRLFE